MPRRHQSVDEYELWLLRKNPELAVPNTTVRISTEALRRRIRMAFQAGQAAGAATERAKAPSLMERIFGS